MSSRKPSRPRKDSGSIRDVWSRGHGEGGFTLFELLIAVAILSMLVTVVSLSFSSTFRIVEAVEEDQGRAHLARLSLSRMAEELTMARKQASSPWIGRNGTQNGQPSDFVTFVFSGHISARANAPETDLSRVLYALEGTRLLRFARPNLYAVPLPVIEQVEMARGVVGLNIRYYDQQQSAWMDEWDGRVRSTLPPAVMIELTLSNARGEPRTFTEWVTIPVQTS
jgi:type II secretion system protein J